MDWMTSVSTLLVNFKYIFAPWHTEGKARMKTLLFPRRAWHPSHGWAGCCESAWAPSLSSPSLLFYRISNVGFFSYSKQLLILLKRLSHWTEIDRREQKQLCVQMPCLKEAFPSVEPMEGYYIVLYIIWYIVLYIIWYILYIYHNPTIVISDMTFREHFSHSFSVVLFSPPLHHHILSAHFVFY